MNQLSVDFKTINTRSYQTNYALSHNDEKYEIALEELEFAFSENELNYIQNTHNNGVWFTDIAKNIRRDDYEVLIAIMHMLRKGRKIKPLNLKGIK